MAGNVGECSSSRVPFRSGLGELSADLGTMAATYSIKVRLIEGAFYMNDELS